MRIGILAWQGAFVKHIAILNQLKVELCPSACPIELNGVDGLVITGGE